MSEENSGPMPNAKSPKKIKNKRVKILLRFPKEFVDLFDTHRVLALCFKIEYESLFLTLSTNSKPATIKENIFLKYLVGYDRFFLTLSHNSEVTARKENIFPKYLVGYDRLFLTLVHNSKTDDLVENDRIFLTLSRNFET